MPKLHDRPQVLRKPEWLKIRLHRTAAYAEVRHIVESHALHTICSSGMCPNKAECWSRRTATFMILGEICTRGCRFCATRTGRPLAPDADEPQKVAESIALMGLALRRHHLRHARRPARRRCRPLGRDRRGHPPPQSRHGHRTAHSRPRRTARAAGYGPRLGARHRGPQYRNGRAPHPRAALPGQVPHQPRDAALPARAGAPSPKAA